MKLFFILLASLLLTSCLHSPNRSIVMIRGNELSCTAFEIKAPSGNEYLLTAGHCAALLSEKNTVEVLTEDGNSIQSRLIAIDIKSDAMLLEAAPGLPALEMAQSDGYGERVRIIGHGFALPLWEVDGYIIGDIEIMAFPETVCSAGAQPGHSGSPVIDPSGDVVGVMSTSNGFISGFVRLIDLQAFLRGY